MHQASTSTSILTSNDDDKILSLLSTIFASKLFVSLTTFGTVIQLRYWSRQRYNSIYQRNQQSDFLPMTPFSIHRRTMMLWMTTVLSFSSLFSDAFSPNSPASFSPSYLRPVSTVSKHLNHYQSHSHSSSSSSSWTVLHASSNNDIHTVQILMSDTGGGHRASANALRDALDVLHPGKFECDIVDIYTEYGPFWPFNGYVQGYKIMAKYSWMWDLFFRFGETEFGLWLNDFLLTTFCYEPFKGCLARPSGSTDRRADMVISVHPLCQDLPLKILKDLDGGKERTTPFITVVTDLGGAHKTWFNPGVDKCFVPSDALNKKAQSRGLDPKTQIIQYGLPIRKGFWSTISSDESTEKSSTTISTRQRRIPFFSKVKNSSSSNDGPSTSSKDRLRQQLGLDTDLPTCLVVGGGDGMGGIVPISSALGKKLGEIDDDDESPKFQMVVVCGSNKEAQSTLQNMDWGPGVEVNIQGFVSNMDEWMNAADCLVTKAGPGTIAEASICGLPCMLFAYLPGQEEGNVPYVENSGFGKYSGNPDVIADTVSSWLSSPETMESMKEAALKAARPSATLDIARDLADIAFSTKEKSSAKEKVLMAVR